TLQRGRDRLGDVIAPVELAHVYGLALDYPRAVDLYLEALSRDPSLRPAIQARLTRMIDGQGAPEAFATAFSRAAALDPLNRGVRELQAWLALEQEEYDVALDAVRALDRLENEQGESLVTFAAQAVAAGADEAAAQALDEVLTRHSDGPMAPDARLARARLNDARATEARERTGLGPTPFADAARDDYLAFLDLYAAHRSRSATLLALATLLRDVYRDFDASEARLTEAAEGFDVGVANRARLVLGDVALGRGDLETARERFSDVDATIRIGPLAEQARYELALIDFYQGFMYSALARAEALDENTAAEATNDAIALRVTLNDALDPTVLPGPDVDLTQDPLHIYGRAALRYRRGLFAEALATLDSLDATLSPGHALADESLYLRATVLLNRGEATNAIATLDRLLAEQPLSFFLDRALRLQAQTFERDLRDPASAAERYDRLLERFPGSPLAPEAREALRRLRSHLGAS
ncbi:MAG: tetratricopeptide repeat protein, partial [Bacteroidota bacterium]